MLCDYGVDGKIVAHEYVGEAYLMVGDLARAQKHLEELRKICLPPCAELADLERVIAEYRANQRGRFKHFLRAASSPRSYSVASLIGTTHTVCPPT